MFLQPVQYLLGALSGCLVGFSLGLFGGGGSILAVPLMVYLVGVPVPHVAIGTSAFAVAASALINLLSHMRKHIKWRCVLIFSGGGVGGALVGSSLGKLVDGQHLLLLFAILMLVVGVLMFRSRRDGGDPTVECNRQNAGKVIAFGGMAGAVSGFFGIGGGFLIVPSLVAATGMPIINAIGSSLAAITIFGFTTAANYTISGLVDFFLATIFIIGGGIGGVVGSLLAKRLSAYKGVLNILFSVLIFVVATYMIYRSINVIV